jgi:outer membrane cobalamin receptor
MRKITLRTILLFVFAFSLSHSLHSQSESSNAQVSGKVTDASGAGVGGVIVTAELEGAVNGQSWKATSTTDGQYTLRIPPGRYRIRFERSSFVRRDSVLQFGRGESPSLNVRLEIQPLSSNVVVTAEIEPVPSEQSLAPVTVITRDEIEHAHAVSLPDLLRFAPGVSIGKNGAEGGLTSVFLAGGNSSDTKVLVDGVPLNDPGGAVDFSNFTLENIDKVEIVRGAESAFYGTDALAGVLQVFTHLGTTRTPALNVYAEGGSFSSGQGGAELSGLAGKFDYSGAVSYFQTAGQGPNNAFLNRVLSGNFGWSFTDTHQLRLSLRNTTSQAGLPGQTLLLPADLDQGDRLHSFSESARWDFSSGGHWRHQISGTESFSRNHSFNPKADFFDANDPSCTPRAPNAVPSFTCDFPYDFRSEFNRAGAHAQTSYLLPKLGVTAGYDYEVENGAHTYLRFGHVRRNNQGGYLNARWQALARLTLDAGGRAEANGNFGTRVVPRAGASWVAHFGQGFWGHTRLRTFYGQGVKEPDLFQSFGFDPCDPGNPNLRPERSRTWIAGFDQKLAGDRWKISAEYFQNRFYDIISFGAATAPPGSNCSFYGSFFNTDLARARGTTLSAETKPYSWLGLTGSYTYDDSRVLKSPNAFDPALVAGNRLFRRPVHSGSLLLDAAYRSVRLNLAGYFSGRRTDSDFLFLGMSHYPGYARFDLATSYDLRTYLSFYARLTNLFDKRYQEALGYPALGRDFRLGMNYRFSGRN